MKIVSFSALIISIVALALAVTALISGPGQAGTALGGVNIASNARASSTASVRLKDGTPILTVVLQRQTTTVTASGKTVSVEPTSYPSGTGYFTQLLASMPRALRVKLMTPNDPEVKTYLEGRFANDIDKDDFRSTVTSAFNDIASSEPVTVYYGDAAVNMALSIEENAVLGYLFAWL